jgi:hypothetical protein
MRPVMRDQSIATGGIRVLGDHDEGPGRDPWRRGSG